MTDKIIFYDASLKRWRMLKFLGGAFLSFALVFSALFVLSLVHLTSSRIPDIVKEPHRSIQHSPFAFPEKKKQLQHFMLDNIYNEFRVNTEKENSKALKAGRSESSDKGEKIVAGFYAIWQESGIHSLKANADKLTHIIPEWLHLKNDGAAIDFSDWDPETVYLNKEVVETARKNNISIMPLINNYADSNFDPKRAHALLSNPDNQQKFIASIKSWLKKNDFQGVNIDLENLYPNDYKLMHGFMAKLADALHEDHLEVSIDIEAGSSDAYFKKMAASSDFIVLMAYDEHSAESEPGPITSFSWYSKLMSRIASIIPPDKLVVALGNYAYDWTEGKHLAESITFQQALITARDNSPDDKAEDIIDFDPEYLNPTFNYEDEKGLQHEVWMLDAVSAANQWKLAANYRVRGGALWVLGSEDPSIWKFFNHKNIEKKPDIHELEEVNFPYDVEFIGEGDILKLKSHLQKGSRVLEIDEKTGFCTDESYKAMPSSYVIERSGLQPKTVALTFDDGPVSPYTAQILDVLKEYKVPATFFVVGDNIENNMELLERIWDEGHEIGNHTFTHPNIAEVSEKRALLELNATERAIQSVTGRSTILFRAPYNADAEPTSAEEVKPILLASMQGYVTVGEYIDPQDWNPEITGKTGIKKRTDLDIANQMIEELHAGHGNAVLLHDGGGDRSQTVNALKIVIPQLLKEGYKFARVSDLMNTSRDAVMPKAASNEKMLIRADRVVFEAGYYLNTFLTIAFIASIVLGTLRVLFVIIMTPLALKKERKMNYDPSWQPRVSILVPAYNEMKVIAATINAALETSYSNYEIIVVDDGSSDGTSDEVQRLFGDEERVRLVTQKNQGKWAALNNGIANSSGEILVCLDADTLLEANSVSMLVRRFCDPNVGAVAGNLKVGNRINILTFWQAIEYITNQNMDRRVFGLMNAVTVVPGAVGAWRREAVVKAGGFSNDTLAEDMDLTWRVRKMGYRTETEMEAIGHTETPDNMGALFKQRFRWTYGTLQCLWKHKKMLFKYGFFGWVMLPSMWLFQIIFQILSPIVDLQIIIALLKMIQPLITRGLLNQDWQPLPGALANLYYVGFMYSFFFVIEFISALVAFSIEKERKNLLWWLFWQRFVYRQLMYAVVLKAFKTALKGIHTGWGKLERKGIVKSH
ncbi:polysaccharide deacetylase family protein [Desulforegula conservatrix]|uniref:polysaccharide deacetylase family protein n=1 Tax=Desulforegula conservatrix TaxID=153026 RepID=UPI0003F9CE8A|nr:polysaccharide deacetylase family protein [Desulforegula conservatrix]